MKHIFKFFLHHRDQSSSHQRKQLLLYFFFKYLYNFSINIIPREFSVWFSTENLNILFLFFFLFNTLVYVVRRVTTKKHGILRKHSLLSDRFFLPLVIWVLLSDIRKMRKNHAIRGMYVLYKLHERLFFFLVQLYDGKKFVQKKRQSFYRSQYWHFHKIISVTNGVLHIFIKYIKRI